MNAELIATVLEAADGVENGVPLKDFINRDQLTDLIIEMPEVIRRLDLLDKLEAAGVDNWEGYEYVCSEEG